MAELGAETVRSDLQATPGSADPVDLTLGQGVGTPVRS
jgi:hypothetical protein